MLRSLPLLGSFWFFLPVSFLCYVPCCLCLSAFLLALTAGPPSEAVSGAPSPPSQALPPHLPANRVSLLPSLWLNLLSALSYSGSVPACPSPPGLPPPRAGEGAGEGVLAWPGLGTKGLTWLPTRSCLVAAKIMGRLLVGQVGGSLRQLWGLEGPIREERPLPQKDWGLDSGEFLARGGAFAECG